MAWISGPDNTNMEWCMGSLLARLSFSVQTRAYDFIIAENVVRHGRVTLVRNIQGLFSDVGEPLSHFFLNFFYSNYFYAFELF
jgi:hypothetical protein